MNCCNLYIDKGEYRFDYFLSKNILIFEILYMMLYLLYFDIWLFVYNNSFFCCFYFLMWFVIVFLKGKFFIDMI